MTSRTILLVDDDNDLRETLVEQLSLYEEFSTLEETTAGKGIQTARANQIDLLIMDVGLLPMWMRRVNCRLTYDAEKQGRRSGLLLVYAESLCR